MHPLVFAIAAAGLAAIVADRRGDKPPAFRVLKPLTTILVIALALLAPPGPYPDWIAAALVLSLVGDVALLYEGNRAFVAGLSAFLLAHLAFAVAFLTGIEPGLPPAWIAAPLVAGLAYFGWLLPRTGRLRAPVAVYGLALLAMVVAAAMRPGSLALTGAGLFLLSDSALAYRRFVRPFPGAQALVLATYWSAITLIALSAHSL